MDTIRIFLASPGDLKAERALTKRAIERLRFEYTGRASIDFFAYEDEPQSASGDFQSQIPATDTVDVLVVMFWSKLGTPLGAGWTRSDGSRYESGTVFEFERGLAQAKVSGRPIVLFYQCTAPIVMAIDAPDVAQRQHEQQAVEAYIGKWFATDELGATQRARTRFASLQELGQTIENHLRGAIEQTLSNAGKTDRAVAAWKGSPFRGLKPFEAEHAPVFCGRETAVGQVLDAIDVKSAQQCAFVLVSGKSGCGKSSLMRAGVIPALAEREAKAGRQLRRAIFRPGEAEGDLLGSLATQICGRNAVPELRNNSATGESFEEIAARSPAEATIVLRTQLSNANASIVILLDQLEEMFTHREVTQDQRAAFLSFVQLLAVQSRILMLATLRSDYGAQASENPIFVQLKARGGQVDLLPPSEPEISNMIRIPARAAGLRFDTRAGVRLDDVLRDEAVRNTHSLPLLEFTLQQLYEDASPDGLLRFHTYDGFKGLRGSIATKAEAVFGSLSEAAQKSFGRIFAGLGTADPDAPTRVARRRILRRSFASDPAALEFIDTFDAARLFIAEATESGDTCIEVAHEALLSEWDRSAAWFRRNEEFVRLRARISTAATIWQQEGRKSDRLAFAGRPLDEVRIVGERGRSQEVQLDAPELEYISASIAEFERRARRRRAVQGSFVALGLLAMFAAIVAMVWRSQAVRQADEARLQAQLAHERANTARRSIDFVTEMFEKLQPRYALGEDVTVRQVLERTRDTVGDELSGEPAAQARVLRAIGSVYASTGDTDQSIDILGKAVALQESTNAEWDDRAAAHVALADAYYLAYDYDRATENYQAANKIIVATGQQESEVAGDVQFGMADVAESLAKKDEHANAAISIYTRKFGATDARVIRARHELARLHVDAGDSTGAITPLETLRKDMIAATGRVDSPDVAEISSTLATAYWQTADNTNAETYFGEALRTFEKVYDSKDMELANVLHSLGRVQLEVCQLEDARRNIERSLSIQDAAVRLPRALGVFSNYNLGLIHQRAGRDAEAQASFVRAIGISDKYLDELRERIRRRNAEQEGNRVESDFVPEQADALEEAMMNEADSKVLMARASAFIAQSEYFSRRAERRLARKALDAAADIYELLSVSEGGWRFGLLQSARALLSEDEIEARKLLAEGLQSFGNHWKKGSLFAQIAKERLRALGGPAEMVGCPPTKAIAMAR